MSVGLLLLAIQAVAALNTATLLRPRARIFLQLAEDYDFFEEEENEGLSVTTRDALLAPGSSVEADVADLLKNWQETQAFSTSDGTWDFREQERMMASWRQLVADKEKALLKAKRKELASDASIPAFLTGWLVEDESPAMDEPAIDEKAVEALIEAEAEKADKVDASFISEWQLQAERTREKQSKERDGPSAKPAFLPSFFEKRRTEFKEKVKTDEQAIGIDLGTTNCAVAAIDAEGKPVIIPTADGERVFPSIVSFLSKAGKGQDSLATPLLQPNGTSRVLVGESARRQFVTNPFSTFASTKRLIGRTASAQELKQLAALDVPHAVSKNTREVLLACPSLRRAISPVDTAAELVRSLVRQAEDSLDRKVTSAVVTVPAYFDDSQRCATETACLLAGLEKVRLLREPEAAALSYALEQRKDTRIMVFDLGGGTFDVSILDVGSGIVEVIASSGDPRLGGNDWDSAIAQWLEDAFIQEHGKPLDGFARRRLLDASEAAKIALSEQQTTQIELPFLVGDCGLNVTLSRRKFEALCRGLLLRLVQPMREVADVAGIELDEERMGTLVKGNNYNNAAPKVQQWQRQVAWRWRRMSHRTGSSYAAGLNRPLQGVPISKVLLVGGATRMPSIGRFIKRMTGLTVKPTVQPEEAVALGAAVQAGIFDGVVAQKVFNPYQHERATRKLGDDPDVWRA